MKNEYFEKDYSVNIKDAEKERDLVDRLIDKGVFQAFQDKLLETQKYIVPEIKDRYDYMVSRCDWYAHLEHGRIEAKVDYEKYDAWINIYCPFFEFETPDRLHFLKEATENAEAVTFQTENGMVRMHLYFDYFEDTEQNDSAFEESWDALLALLDDKDILQLLKDEADGTGCEE